MLCGRAQQEKFAATLHGKARGASILSMDGPCQERSLLNFFTNTGLSAYGCMEHCQKLGYCAPAVTTLEQWENLLRELNRVTAKVFVYLPVSKGEVNNDLGRLVHWREDVKFKKGEKGMWRDFYTGQQLENYNRTWVFDQQRHCAGVFLSKGSWKWGDAECLTNYPGHWCPFQNGQVSAFRPNLLLRGLCTSSHLRGNDPVRGLWYKAHHEPSDLNNTFFVSGMSTRIEYHPEKNQWVISDSIAVTTAVSLARRETYMLGKYNWTIANDHKRCHEESGVLNGEGYKTELKLSGCKQGFKFDFWGKMHLDNNGEFTCNDGQCVNMSDRCDKIPDCKDGSDEQGCQLVSLVKGYDKHVPPFSVVRSRLNKTLVPVTVNVTIQLLKIMDIDEEEHTLDLQFEINLEWLDYRLNYNNLKKQSFLNAFSEEDLANIWLPLVVYENTNQKETTRLGWTTEWSTSVYVTREGSFSRHVSPEKI